MNLALRLYFYRTLSQILIRHPWMSSFIRLTHNQQKFYFWGPLQVITLLTSMLFLA